MASNRLKFETLLSFLRTAVDQFPAQRTGHIYSCISEDLAAKLNKTIMRTTVSEKVLLDKTM